MSNIVYPEIEDYILSILPKEEAALAEIRHFGEENQVPIASREVVEFIKFLVKMNRPQHILELGTAIGYSSIHMATSFNQSTIDTVEINDKMVEISKQNIDKLNLSHRIKVYHMDGYDYLLTTDKKYDFIFIDAAKGQYHKYLEESLKCLAPQGLMLCDNILFKGEVAKEKITYKRKRTIIKRLKQLLPQVLSDASLDSSLIPMGDGLLLVRRKNE